MELQKQFYEAYAENEKLATLSREFWGNNTFNKIRFTALKGLLG
jgi:hypothetical protein